MLILAACEPEIGDDCSLSTDCSSTGDRICDTTQPGGYCTIYNCHAGSCPDEAICVAFGTAVSAARGCYDPQDSARRQRTFCMRKCDSDGDCRSDYDCIDMRDEDNPFGAIVIEDGGSGRVCSVPFSGEPIPGDTNIGVCTGTDAQFPDPIPWQPTGGTAGTTGGSAGGAGRGGAAGGSAGGAGRGGASGAPGGAAGRASAGTSGAGRAGSSG